MHSFIHQPHRGLCFSLAPAHSPRCWTLCSQEKFTACSAAHNPSEENNCFSSCYRLFHYCSTPDWHLQMLSRAWRLEKYGYHGKVVKRRFPPNLHQTLILRWSGFAIFYLVNYKVPNCSDSLLCSFLLHFSLCRSPKFSSAIRNKSKYVYGLTQINPSAYSILFIRMLNWHVYVCHD